MSGCMMTGKLITLAGQLMAELNAGNVTANKVLGSMIKSKIDVTRSIAAATQGAGESQAAGMLAMGIAGIVGGTAGIAGGVAGSVNGMSEFGELKALSSMDKAGEGVTSAAARLEAGVAEEAEGTIAARLGEEGVPAETASETSETALRRSADEAESTVPESEFNTRRAGLSDSQRDLARDTIAAKHQRGIGAVVQAVTQSASGIGQSSGQLAQSGYTTTGARQQAAGDLFKGAADSLGQQMGGTEGVASGSQSAFASATSLPTQYMQYAVAASKAV